MQKFSAILHKPIKFYSVLKQKNVYNENLLHNVNAQC